MKASEIPKTGKYFWTVLIGRGSRGLIGRIIERFRDKGLNYLGQKFKPYSRKYDGVGWRTVDVGSEKQRPVFLESYRSRKMKGIAHPRQESTSGEPDMVLSGSLRRGLMPEKITDTSGTFGWIGPNAVKVRHLSEIKNYQIVGLSGSKILHDDEEEFIRKEIEKKIASNIKAYEKKPITIKLGK